MSRRTSLVVRGLVLAVLGLALAYDAGADASLRTGGASNDLTTFVDQRFHVGDDKVGEGTLVATGVPISPVLSSCHGGDLIPGTDVDVMVPVSTPFVFDTGVAPTVTAVNVGTSTTGLTGTTGAISFQGNRTVRANITAQFQPGNNFFFNNLKVIGLTTPMEGTALNSISAPGQTIPFVDSAMFYIANPPGGASMAQNVLSPNTTNVACNSFTITECNVTPTPPALFNGAIRAVTDIRLTIPPSAVGVTWNGGAGAASSGNAKINTVNNITYADGNRTAIIDVTADFAQAESAIISGLRFNVASNAPDQTFSINVRLGFSTNYTAHATLTNAVRVQGLPTLLTTGSPNPILYTMGAAPAAAGTITIRESTGTGKMTNGTNLDVIIPANFNCEWAPVVPTTGITGAGSGAVGVPTFVGTNILRIPVTASFGANQLLTITGAQLRQFSARNATSRFLGLDLDGDTVPEVQDSIGRRIGQPQISSSNDDVFTINQGTANLNTITIADDVTNRVLSNGTQVRIHITSGSTLVFTGTVPGRTGGLAGGAVSFEDANKTMVLTWTSNVLTSGTITSAEVTVPNNASFGNLQLFMTTTTTPGVIVTNTSPQNLIVGTLPTMSSVGPQTFTVNDLPTTLQNLTIDTDTTSSFQLFQNGNSLELVIPAGVAMEWTNPQPSLTFSNTASARVNNTPASWSYPDPKTLRIPIISDWASDDQLTFVGLQVRNFTAASAGAGLQLRVRVGGPIACTDAFIKGIGAPTISSAANQVFGIGDPNTTISQITVTDDATNARILAGTTLRVRIPAASTVLWAGTPVLGGSAAPKTGPGAPSYVSGNTILSIPIQTNFAPGDILTISGAQFAISPSTISPASRLELEVNNSTAVNAQDDKTIKVGTRPSVVASGVQTLDFDSNGSIDRLIVTFSEPLSPFATSVTAGLGFTLPGYNISSGSVDVTGTLLTFVLAESGLPDTNALPTLTYDPVVGNLVDVNDNLEMTAAIPATSDGAAPVVVGIVVVDANSDGHPDAVRLTFSENLVGANDITRWTLIDADGTTNLLSGLNNSNFSFQGAGNILQIQLSGLVGTTGTPRFQYQTIAGGIRDAAGNLVPTLTNNHPPVANAGAAQSAIPSKVVLDGSLSSDPDGQTITFAWSYLAGPVVPTSNLVLSNPSTAKPSFLGVTPGMYTFQLVVSDGITSTTTTTTATIINVPPSPRVGPPLTVGLPNFTQLGGSSSSDANGETLGLTWFITAAPDPGAVGANTGNIDTIYGPYQEGVWIEELRATDPATNLSIKSHLTRVSSPGLHVPTADAGLDQIVLVGSQVTLDGRNSSDSDNNITTYSWTPTFGLDDPTSPTPKFTPTGAGIFTYTLTVTDATGLFSWPDSVSILAYKASNLPPLAVASKSPLTTPAVGDLVTLDSTGSMDPEGAPLQYAWAQTDGPTVLVSDPTAKQPTFTPTQPGTYEFTLVVRDGVNSSFPATVNFVVKPTTGYVLPTLSASASPAPGGNGHILRDGTSQAVTLTGVGVLAYTTWTQLAGPAVDFLTNTNVPVTSFIPRVAGTYKFAWTGWDGNDITASAEVTIVVDITANTAPIAIAGPNQTASTGQTISLDGSGSSDADLPPPTLRPSWVQVSGPPVALSSPSALQPTFTPTVAGTYIFVLKVSDGSADSFTDLVQIDVAQGAAPATGGGSGGGGCGFLGVEALLVFLLARRFRKS